MIKRYKRFFADIQLDNNNEVITAHCPNTGSMQGLLDEGNPVLVTKANDPKRKLKYTLEIIKSEGKASTSFLQRKLQIGYNRAARIIDMMEENGIVSKANHVGKREILK